MKKNMIKDLGNSNFRNYFWIAIIEILINIWCLKTDILMRGDEFSSIAVPAFFAGFDWTELCRDLSFHGYGLTVLLTPFFAFFKGDFYTIYLLENLLILCIRDYLTYYIVRKETGKNGVALGVVIVCMVGTINLHGAQLAAGVEPAIELLIVCICALLIKQNESSKKIVYWIISMGIAGYSITVHARSVVIILGIVIIWIMDVWVNRYWNLRRVALVVATAVLSYCLFDFINDNIIEVLYGTGYIVENSVASIANAENVKLYLERIAIYGMDMLKVFMGIMASHIIYSFGVWGIVLYVVAKDVLLRLRKKKIDGYIYIEIFGLVLWLMMNILYSIKGGFAAGLDANKGYTFIRYSMPFAWIIAFCGWNNILSGRVDLNKKSLMLVVVMQMLLCKQFLIFCAPNIKQDNEMTLFNNFVLRFRFQQTHMQYFVMVVLIVFVFVLLYYFLYKMRKLEVIVYIYLIVSIWARVDDYNFFYVRQYEKLVDGVDATITYIEESDYLNESGVYLLNSEYNCKAIQLYFPSIEFGNLAQKTDSNEIIELIENGNVILTNEYYELEGIFCEKLDEGEYILHAIDD